MKLINVEADITVTVTCSVNAFLCFRLRLLNLVHLCDQIYLCVLQ